MGKLAPHTFWGERPASSGLVSQSTCPPPCQSWPRHPVNLPPALLVLEACGIFILPSSGRAMVWKRSASCSPFSLMWAAPPLLKKLCRRGARVGAWRHTTLPPDRNPASQCAASSTSTNHPMPTCCRWLLLCCAPHLQAFGDAVGASDRRPRSAGDLVCGPPAGGLPGGWRQVQAARLVACIPRHPAVWVLVKVVELGLLPGRPRAQACCCHEVGAGGHMPTASCAEPG